MRKKLFLLVFVWVFLATRPQLQAETEVKIWEQGPFVLHLFPQDQVVKLGQTISWFLIAAGGEPLHYQWKLNGKNIPGATANLLRIGSVQASDQGNYTCLIKNNLGLTETESVQLNLQTGTSISIAQKIPSSSLALARAPQKLQPFAWQTIQP